MRRVSSKCNHGASLLGPVGGVGGAVGGGLSGCGAGVADGLCWVAGKKFDVFVTIDKNIRHQQNLKGRNIAVLIIRTVQTTSDARPHIPDPLFALRSIRPGQVVEVGIDSD